MNKPFTLTSPNLRNVGNVANWPDRVGLFVPFYYFHGELLGKSHQAGGYDVFLCKEVEEFPTGVFPALVELGGGKAEEALIFSWERMKRPGGLVVALNDADGMRYAWECYTTGKQNL